MTLTPLLSPAFFVGAILAGRASSSYYCSIRLWDPKTNVYSKSTSSSSDNWKELAKTLLKVETVAATIVFSILAALYALSFFQAAFPYTAIQLAPFAIGAIILDVVIYHLAHKIMGNHENQVISGRILGSIAVFAMAAFVFRELN